MECSLSQGECGFGVEGGLVTGSGCVSGEAGEGERRELVVGGGLCTGGRLEVVRGQVRGRELW